MDKKTSNSAHRLAVKEQKIIPNLVMKVEQFENSLLKLNKKFNIEVTVKPSTSRDFRYKPEISNQDCEDGDIDDVDENISQNEVLYTVMRTSSICLDPTGTSCLGSYSDIGFSRISQKKKS